MNKHEQCPCPGKGSWSASPGVNKRESFQGQGQPGVGQRFDLRPQLQPSLPLRWTQQTWGSKSTHEHISNGLTDIPGVL